MASSLTLMSPSIINLGMTSATKFTYGRCRAVTSRSTSNLTVRAVQENEGPRRLVDIIRTIPELSRNYFRSPSRRALFGGISLLGGFYVAQTISLSFGALGVNDVIAAVICVLLTEYATRFYYSRPKKVCSALACTPGEGRTTKKELRKCTQPPSTKYYPHAAQQKQASRQAQKTTAENWSENSKAENTHH